MTTKTMRRCTRCVMPETWEGITFDEKGICSVCRATEQSINWNARQKKLKDLLSFFKSYAASSNNKYDCLVGYSGGKDTAYTLWAAVKKYGMRPLCVTFDHGFKLSPEGEWNLTEIPKMLDCDHLRFTIGNKLRNALCRKSSEVMGDFCWHCHNGVGAFPARISKLFDIPLQIWGEPPALYQTKGDTYEMDGSEEQDKVHFEKIFQAGVTPDKVLPYGYNLLDLQPMTWPEEAFPLRALYLGNFESWNQYEHVAIIKRELGWMDYPKQETWQPWDKNDCRQELVREAQKKLRRGFGKASFAASKEIREGRITREQGMKLVNEYENKELTGLDELCGEMGMTFNELCSLTNRSI